MEERRVRAGAARAPPFSLSTLAPRLQKFAQVLDLEDVLGGCLLIEKRGVEKE